MPKKARTPEEIEEIKLNILHHALDMINHDGFEGFSMRKLSRRLGVAAVTIYSYYENKDDLYLAILTKGFENLYDLCLAEYNTTLPPLSKLKKMTEAYINFGFDSHHFYNLMFTWNVPKFEDYVGTPLEAAANNELTAALKIYDLFIKAVQEFADPITELTLDEVKFYIIMFWSLIHGYIAGCNNTILSYMHASPFELKKQIIDIIFANVETEIQKLKSNN